MPKVTSVEPQKKNPQRFNVYFDGKFAFGADSDTIVNFRLIAGKEIPEDQLEKILLETEVGKLIDRIYGLFTRRSYSEKEIRDYLKRLSFKRKIKEKEELSDIVIESLIEKLKIRDLINDIRFATEWVESRGKKRGLQVLKSELFKKGINREIIDEVLATQVSDVNQEQIAENALEKKTKSFTVLDENTLRKKATEFLLRRGFAYEIAKSVVEKFVKKRYNDS